MTLYQILTCFVEAIKHSSLSAMAQQSLEVDYRLLIGFFHQAFEAQSLLQMAWKQMFTLSAGYLILDEIVIEKSKAGALRLVKRRWKSAGGYVTPAISVVLLLWSNGSLRIPLRFQLWKPESGSHIDAALHLLSWVRNRLKWKPQCVLFDSGFCSGRLLKRIDDYGWTFVCRIPRSRNFEGKALFRYKRQGFWHQTGLLGCGLKVLAVRRANKFYISNRLTWTASEVVKWYGKRHVIEETFKILKGICHWKGCQFSDQARYERFLAVETVAFMVWESNRIEHPEPITIYKLRRKVIFDDFKLQIPHLEGLLDAA